MKRSNRSQNSLSRRSILKSLSAAPLLLRSADLFGASLLFESADASIDSSSHEFADVRLVPHDPQQSPLADVLRLIDPGSDEYVTEKYAVETEAQLKAWGADLCVSPLNHSSFAKFVDAQIAFNSLAGPQETKVRSGFGVDVVRRQFAFETSRGKENFLREIKALFASVERFQTTEFEIFALQVSSDSPLTVHTELRYDIVAIAHGDHREERVGTWKIDWMRDGDSNWRAQRWIAKDETVTAITGQAFVDVTSHALGNESSYREQLAHGADYWRTVLDGAIGVDIYGNNGIATGDYDNDGFDDFYVCQPSGLPNRLYRNRGDGTFEDVTDKAGVGVLDNTSCALFADFDNRGFQDLLVVCGTGPLLFINQGDGIFRHKPDAFKFAKPPQGTFTHAALADYDRDGRLDIYFCTYMYYLGLDQYHYPVPYYDARNGPPNCLFHNEGGGHFVERTEEAGLNVENNRYSFACAWGDSNGNGHADLFVVNDFGTSQLYRNNGNGTFTVVSHEANVEGVGAGMSCAWCDYDNDGKQDVYVPSMWEAAGQRISTQKQFHADAPESIRGLYQRHARGNALYRNSGSSHFENAAPHAAVEMGRWSWCSDFFDFDHDGFSDLYVTNGYISGADPKELAGFFWRQIVAKSPEEARSAIQYERGWNAINELIRSDYTWHGRARNVMFANNRDGSFSEISGPSGLDFIEDSRSFALADIDHDGRLEILLKNRNAPQVRILKNNLSEIGNSIVIRLRGTKSNRDAVGACVTIEAGPIKQQRFLQAGSGFLAQHSKELHFGVGSAASTISAVVRWPSGETQRFTSLPANHQITIEEGSQTFSAAPFAVAKAAQAKPSDKNSEQLPERFGTWLVDPLQAPSLTLPDLEGKEHEIGSPTGHITLLTFWNTASIEATDQLRDFHLAHSRLAAADLQLLAINVDDERTQPGAKSWATSQRFAFSVLMATEAAAGICNIFYRHLFDRRRDLCIPAMFLLNGQGMIVKVYQGSIEIDSLLTDARSIPSSPAERLSKATPFPGTAYHAQFQRNEFTFGVSLYQHGYFDQAAKSFEQVLAKEPDDSDANYNLGSLALRRNDLPLATKYLLRTVELRPDYPEAWNNLGMIAAQQNRPDDAIAHFKKSIELRPQYATAWLNLGNVYRRNRELAQSEDALHHALKITPDDPEVNYSLGMLYAQQEKSAEAHKFLDKAIELRPNYPEALNNLGVLYVREHDLAKAEAQFNLGIRLAPEYDQSYLNLARVYAMQGDRGRARDIVQQLLKLHPQNTVAQQTLEQLQ